MSARLESVLDELLTARRMWDSEIGRRMLIEDTAPLDPNAPEEEWERAEAILAAERGILDTPDVYYIEPDFHRLVLAAAEMFEPEPLLHSDLPSPSGYVRLPMGVYVPPWKEPEPGEEPYITEHSAFGWSTSAHEQGLLLCYFVTRDDIPQVAHMGVYPSRYIGWVFESSETYTKLVDPWHEGYRYPRVFFRLVMQRLTQVETSAPPRAVRKRHARAGYEPGKLQVVRLRRPAARPAEDRAGKTVEWSQRWLVRGHWRQQWYPSIQAHRQIWISDFVKGPEDKELIIRPRVFDVAV